MKTKKLMALLMAVIMLLSCLVGCSTPSDSKTTEAGKQTGAGTTEAESTEAPTESLFNEGGTLPIVNEEVTLKVLTQDPTNYAYEKANEAGLWSWLEEKTGIHFEVESYSAEELKQKLPLIMATPDDMPDLFFRCDFTDADVLQYGQSGQLLMLDDYIDQYGVYIKEVFDTLDYAYGAAVSSDGHIYALPAFNARVSDVVYTMNSRFLENAGIKEVPTTIEELYEAFKIMKTVDANGDGTVGNEYLWCDQPKTFKRQALSIVGIACYWPWEGCIFDAKDDEVYFVPTSEEYKYLLQWLNKFYEEGMLDSEIFTQTASEVSAKFNSDLIFMSGLLDDPESSSYKGKSGSFYPVPLSSAVSDEPIYVTSAPYQTAIGAISAYTEYPEICTLLMDYLYSEDASRTSYWGLEGVDYKVVTEEPWVIESPDPANLKLQYGKTPILVPRWNRNEWLQPASTTLGKEKAGLVSEYGKVGWQNYLHFTDEESEQITVIGTDLGLYCDDYFVGFITGEYDLEKDWDSYVAKCNSMKTDELTKVYQAAYDRYYGLD